MSKLLKCARLVSVVGSVRYPLSTDSLTLPILGYVFIISKIGIFRDRVYDGYPSESWENTG